MCRTKSIDDQIDELHREIEVLEERKADAERQKRLENLEKFYSWAWERKICMFGGEELTVYECYLLDLVRDEVRGK